MPKGPGVNGGYIRFRLPEEDKRGFEAAAKKMRLSLSAWLRLAGLEKIERTSAAAPVKSTKAKPGKVR